MIRPSPASLFRALTTLSVIGVLSIALLEVLVRVMLPQESPSLWLKPDERYGHLMKPNFHQRFQFSGTDFVMEVQTNSLGFRDEEPPPVRPGVLNVVFAGDSFTFGHGVRVEDRFDTLVEAAMRAAGKPLRSLNVGVNAWGTLQATRYIQGHLGMLSPDVIVLTFCENDPHDDSYFLEHGISFDRVRFPSKDFLRAHSHLFRLAQHLYLVWRKTSLPAPRGAGGDAEARAEEADKTAVQAARAGREGVPVTAFAPVISEAQWQRTEGYLKDFLAGFHAHNPAGRVIVQATDPLNEEIREHLTAMAGRLPGLIYVDLAPAAAALPLEERRLPFDGHWSPAMHQRSAEALTAALLQLSR